MTTPLRLAATCVVAVVAAVDIATALLPGAPRIDNDFAAEADGTLENTAKVSTGQLKIPYKPIEDEHEVPTEVFPGVHLPAGEVPKPINYLSVDAKVLAFLGPATLTVPAATMGQPKSSSFQMALDLLRKSQKLDDQIPNSKDYKFSGNGNHSENLLYFLKTNPFMATALTETDNGFELKTFDPKDPDNEENPSFYRKILGALDGTGHRVNVRFDSKLTKIESIQVYDDVFKAWSDRFGKRIWRNADSKVEYWTSSVTYNLLFYASCVHATLHVLHYLLTAALDHCSEGFDALNQWAKIYATNVPDRYAAVGRVLISGQPSLLALLGLAPQEAPSSLAATFAILTGSSGFGASGAKLRPILQDMLDKWGKNPSNWMEGMMNISADKMERAGILAEFWKHHDLIKPFASDTAGVLRTIDGDAYTNAERQLKDYLKRCGSFTSGIRTLEQWIELMSVTGIVHGSTLSYTRLVASKEVIRWRDIQSEVWEAADLNIVLMVLATICGIDEHRHAMTSSTDSPSDTYAKGLQEVLDKYDAKASSLKEAYKAEIMKDPKEFNNFGWILSDFCPDGFDGKQLTVATYI